MITAIAMNLSDHTALKKSYLLYVSFTYSAWTFKEYDHFTFDHRLHFTFFKSIVSAKIIRTSFGHKCFS